MMRRAITRAVGTATRGLSTSSSQACTRPLNVQALAACARQQDVAGCALRLPCASINGGSGYVPSAGIHAFSESKVQKGDEETVGQQAARGDMSEEQGTTGGGTGGSGAGVGGELVESGAGESVWAMGMRVTVKTKSANTGGAYSIMAYHLSPGDASDEHTHDNEDEAWFVLDGELEWKFEDKVFKATKGDFIHMPRSKSHSFKNVSNQEAHMLVHCIPGGLEEYFLEVGKAVSPDPHAKKPENLPEDVKKASEIGRKYGLTYMQKVQSLASEGSGASGGGQGGNSSSKTDVEDVNVSHEVVKNRAGHQ